MGVGWLLRLRYPAFLVERCGALPVEPPEERGWSLRSRWAVGGPAGSWVLSKSAWASVGERTVIAWAALSVGRSFGAWVTTCGLPFMSALEKNMHLGRLPSRPPLPGSGGSQSGAKMRMGYVTRGTPSPWRPGPRPLENGVSGHVFRAARKGRRRLGASVGGGLETCRQIWAVGEAPRRWKWEDKSYRRERE